MDPQTFREKERTGRRYFELCTNKVVYDFTDKFMAYRSIPSFREYLLVSQERPLVTHYVRQDNEQWVRSDIVGLDGTVELVSLQCELTLREIYQRVEFPPPQTLGVIREVG